MIIFFTRIQKIRRRNKKCLYDTSPIEIEEDVRDRKITIVKIMTGKTFDAYIALPLKR